jgi:hypothetical protein
MARPRLLSIELLYDYWDDKEQRHKEGSVIRLKEADAAAMVNIGKAKLVVGASTEDDDEAE